MEKKSLGFWYAMKVLVLVPAHKEVCKYPNYTAALLPWTLTESVEKEFFHAPPFTFPGMHLFSIWPSFWGCSFLRRQHCGSYTLWPFSYNLLLLFFLDQLFVRGFLVGWFFFKPAFPQTVTFRSNILLHLARNDRRTPKVKTKCRDLPWHLKYSKSFPSLSMLYWASKNDYKGTKAHFQQIQ